MSGLVLTITDAGRAALVNASNTGTNPVLMASVGVSATSFTPTPAGTTLPDEIKRISTIAGEAVADDTIHVTVRDESADLYTVRSFGLYLADGTLFAVYSQASPIMEKSAQALLLLTIDVIFADIEATDITFGDASFTNPPATTERQGVVELATEAETETGTDGTRAVTPKGVKAAVTKWLDDRFGDGAPSSFIKGLLTSASAAALRLSLELKSAALKDEGSGKGLDADLLDGQHGSYYSNVVARLGYTPWGPNNDGSGSGLDADLLDGLHASAFARLNGADFTGAISVPLGSSFNFGSGVTISKTTNGGILFLRSGTASLIIQNAAGSANNLTVDNATGNVSARGKITSGGHVEVPNGSAFVSNGKAVLREAGAATWLYSAGANGFTLRNAANTATIASISDDGRANFTGLMRAFNTVWDSGNDGSGSGLDGDLLDGQHGSFYQNASNLNAGTVPTARLSGTYSISVSGNAGTATKLATARTLSLTGDVTGSVSFDGSANAGISATLAASKVLEKLVTVDGSGSGVDADLLDGLHASAFAKLADFVASKATNGYCRLPNGMIIQAGRYTQSANTLISVVFPLAFPNLCMGVVTGGTGDADFGAEGNTSTVYSGSVTTGGFQSHNANDNSTTAYFIAFGY